MSVNYKGYEFQVYEHISELGRLLCAEGIHGELGQLNIEVQKLRRNFEEKRFRVAVVGEFNRGKTTFVNALLGKEILPADYLPTTAAVNRITYSDVPNAYIVMKNGQKKAVQITDLADYITKLSSDAAQNASQIQEAVVEYPSLFCRNGVDLIDTPGMNDEDSMNQVTISQLESIDLAIVAVDATMPFSMTECAFTSRLLESHQVCRIIIVATKIDMIPEREQNKLIDYMIGRIRADVKTYLMKTHEPDSEVMQKYHAIFDEPCVFAVSALDALDALSCNNMELFEKSGFLHLNSELPRIIMRSQNNSIILNTEHALSSIISKYKEWLLKKQPAASQLNQIKETFAQVGYASVLDLFIWSDTEACRFLPDSDDELSVIRKCFIQALGEMKTLSYEELKRVLIPVTRTLFQTLNTRYHKNESSYISEYQEKVLKPCKNVLCRKLNEIIMSFPEIYKEINAKIALLDDCFEFVENDTEIQDFYWVRQPIPESGMQETNWNVMSYVDSVIRDSVEDYRSRRWMQISGKLGQAKKKLDDRISKLVKDVYGRTADYIEQSDREEEGRGVLSRLQRLENDSRELRERFLSEIS